MQKTELSSKPIADNRGSCLKKLGPGLITGAADDDPSGIATYSQAGAQFGLNTLWTCFFTFPLMVGIQVISAKIGRVSGHGIATNIRRHYSWCCCQRKIAPWPWRDVFSHYHLTRFQLVLQSITLSADLDDNMRMVQKPIQ